MRSRGRGLSLVVALSSCSFAMTGVPSGWDGTTEPECSDSIGTVVADGLATGVAALGVAIADKEGSGDEIVLPLLGVAIAYFVAGLYGEVTYDNCRNAKAQWRIGGAVAARSTPIDDDDPSVRQRPRPHSRLRPAVEDRTDPSSAKVFWCLSDGRCFVDPEACATRGDCRNQPAAWCARMSESKRYLCARTRGTCIDIADAQRAEHGECIERTADDSRGRVALPAVTAEPFTSDAGVGDAASE